MDNIQPLWITYQKHDVPIPLAEAIRELSQMFYDNYGKSQSESDALEIMLSIKEHVARADGGMGDMYQKFVDAAGTIFVGDEEISYIGVFLFTAYHVGRDISKQVQSSSNIIIPDCIEKISQFMAEVGEWIDEIFEGNGIVSPYARDYFNAIIYMLILGSSDTDSVFSQYVNNIGGDDEQD